MPGHLKKQNNPSKEQPGGLTLPGANSSQNHSNQNITVWAIS
jgi:hypothetical protein